MELDNKKMWESLIRECDNSHDQSISNWIFNVRSALADQGLQYNSGTKKIESLEPKPEYYKCIKEYRGFTIGKVYKTNENGDLPSDHENLFVIWIENPYFKEYFRPATPEEIPHSESDQEELNEFEKEIAHVLVYKCYDGGLETEEEIHNAYRQYYDDARFFAPMLLAKARKQLQPVIDAEIDEAYRNQDEVQYKNGYNKAVEDACDWLYKLYDKQGYLDIADLDDMKEAIKGE